MQVARVVRKPDSILLRGRLHTSFVCELSKLCGCACVSGERRCVSTAQEKGDQFKSPRCGKLQYLVGVATPTVCKVRNAH
jgi:uncharacterized ferredoxin-like protein